MKLYFKLSRQIDLKHLLLTSMILLLCNTHLPSQTKAGIQELFQGASPKEPGCVCAVSKAGQIVYQGAYGQADLEKEIPLQPDMLFDAGSLTKQFVAAVILLLAEEGKLRLQDPIHQYIPELPTYSGPISINHLLTHTSGLRDWTGLQALAGNDFDALALILKQKSLNFPPGEQWSYSNSGYVLLKELIARITGKSFSEYSRVKIFVPLGMKSTQYVDDLNQPLEKRARAYEKKQGQWNLAMLLNNDRGGGGALFTTAEDLLRWSQGWTSGKLGKYVREKLQEPVVLNNGRKLDYGRGLFLGSYRATPEIWHSGSAAGYKSWLGFYPEHQLFISILCNSGDGTDRAGMAHRIVDLLIPGLATSNPGTGAPPIPAIEGLKLQDKTGHFLSEDGSDLIQLTIDRGRFRIAGGPGLEALGVDSFRRWGNNISFMSQDAFKIQFRGDDQFILTSMDGKIRLYKRLEPPVYTTGQLEMFRGTFMSDETQARLEATVKDGILHLRLIAKMSQELPFKAIGPDRFEAGAIRIRFMRNQNGAVIALELSNPVVQDIRFEKLLF